MKVEIGVGKGRTKGDKRQAIAARDVARDIEREVGRAKQVRLLTSRFVSCRDGRLHAMPAVDIDSLVAIDVHTHAETSEITGCGALSLEFQEAVDRYFGGHVHASAGDARWRSTTANAR